MKKYQIEILIWLIIWMGWMICQRMVLIQKIVIEIGSIAHLYNDPIKGLTNYLNKSLIR